MNLQSVRAQEETLRQQIRLLSDEQRKQFYQQVNSQLKDPDTYATLNYLFVTGLHHFYLGKVVLGCLDLLIFVVGVVLMFVGFLWVGVALLVAITVLELKALFQSEIIVTDYNNQMMEKLLRNYQT